ncbi:MAG: PPOX class probable FMN-dependent enzyme [Candidatus Azotimanducaceae bacterium]|jgi:PPOX class probable FMN-dependent enzyme
MSEAITTIRQLRDVVGEEIPGLEDKNIDYLDDFALDFIAHSPFLVLSTSDAQGRCDASPKGDEPGFVQVIDNKTLLVPDRPGNKLAYGHRNILENPHVGLLFCIPGTSETLRINGIAELSADAGILAELAARGKPAILAIRITVEECFFHCGKAFIRSGLWTPDVWADTPYKVSFGKMYAERKNVSSEIADAIDVGINHDYTHNL